MKPLKLLSTAGLLAASILIVSSCSKSGSGSPGPAPAKGTCSLVQEVSTDPRDSYHTEFEYNSDGELTDVKRFFRNSTALDWSIKAENSTSVFYNSYNRSSYIGKYNGLIRHNPASSVRSLIDHQGNQLDRIEAFSYLYDYKGRLVRVQQSTPIYSDDNEYSLEISYDDNDNVTKLYYYFSTGPRDQTSVVLVSGYDKNPSPYSGIKGWPFIMFQSGWNSWNSLLVVASLSKNNPLQVDINPSAGYFSTHQTLSYTYNDNGYPTERKLHTKGGSVDEIYLCNFNYKCD